jgi:hypothetical protein
MVKPVVHGAHMTVRRSTIGMALAVLANLALAGCDGRDTLDVSGKVTFDGAPVEKGEISFLPVEGGGADGGVIENGTFAFAAKPGSKRVEIRASRPLTAGKQTNPEMGLMYDDYIPAMYNRESTLTAEVSADGERTYSFDLKSKP